MSKRGDDAQPPELLKTSEVTQMLGVTTSTVLSWAYRGRLSFARTPGGQMRFHRQQIEAFQATQPTPHSTRDKEDEPLSDADAHAPTG
ncbi:hypothetical protein Acsp04_05850 [Actinomadura sp. NBRC 104425]|uniref:helix-turn-helix domain-containing protein n=1 Tax=Actinomadura sp. NBRC 104425 TaxID=3032204 RepID=UPI0024A317C9|nr:helix-turn-helix domain-containing protein [Actinomadura sp. NBRC 104425]GLZ10350.1 hypothetical protein Acsp04_05850 [Actinomadura sp. NBRC 104425]